MAFAIAPEGGAGEKDPLAVALTMDTVGPTVDHAVVLGSDAPEVSTGVCIAPG